MALVPYIQVVVQWLTALANAIAAAFGFQITDYVSDFSGISAGLGDVSTGLDDVSTGVGDVGSSAADTNKELDKMLGKFDELNVIDFGNADTSGGGAGSGAGAGGAAGGSLGIPLYDYDALEGALTKNLEEVERKLKNILPYVAAIGAGFLAWKISQKILDFLDRLQNLKNIGGFTSGFKLVGLAGLISDLDEFRKYFEDFLNNGPTFNNVVGMLSEFVGSIGDIFLLLGKTKLGGAFKVIQSIGEIVISIKDMVENGPNWENVTTLVRGLSNFIIALGALTGHPEIAGVGLIIQGVTKVVEELGKNWEAIKKGDWSGVDKVSVVVGVVTAIFGLVTVLKRFSDLKDIKDSVKAVDNIKTVTDVTGSLDTNVGKLSPKLTSLAKNLGLGLVIIMEVAAAAILITGAIWILGEELNQVGLAWEPVIENGSTVATAMGIGVGILVAIGVVAGLLGQAGGTQIMGPIALGTAILVEVGVATLLFIAEIWAIGVGLNQINEAWQPVLNNGETIRAAIETGTAILIAIGVVSAALGVASVASVGLLPLAIALGTSMLSQLESAFIDFVNYLTNVARQLNDELGPELRNLNSNLPGLIDDLNQYINFMELFAGYTADFTKSSAVSGFSGAINTIIGWFVDDPIETFAKDVNKTYEQTRDLNNKLRLANPELAIAINLMSQYLNFLERLEKLTGRKSNIELADSMFVNMKEVGKNLVTGFVDGINSEYRSLSNAIERVLRDTLSSRTARSYGENFGSELGSSIANALRRTSFPRFRGTISTSGDTATIRFNAYAEGGFPETGQLFVAREAGPELVGNIGNRAAVANNDQIVAGIAQAAYQGVSQAMRENTGNERQPVNVYIGNRKVYSGYGQYVSSENNMYGTNTIKV